MSCMWGLYWHCCGLQPATIQPIKVQKCNYEIVLYISIYTFSHFITKLLILKNPQDFCVAHLCLSIFSSFTLFCWLLGLSFVCCLRLCMCVFRFCLWVWLCVCFGGMFNFSQVHILEILKCRYTNKPFTVA